MINFEDIHYLQFGNVRQQAAYKVLVKYKVMERLVAFDPLLAGTIPIGIDTPQSDLDIICCWKNKANFYDQLLHQFSGYGHFSIKETNIDNCESIIACFRLDDFDVEVFGQHIPSREQKAYRHMLVEYKLLLKYGEPFRQQVLQLKQQGAKTEPAFAQLLNLPGNPYEALLQPHTS
ncbi:DUF4269 domain-containing protein [uncultured Pontibacter sp.]|uniref:DUF4269 domain-containing protein n=1 Tax=uncultured Pontibacter sp. TaxID=453356 RepID=UPI002607C13E|nr:DUF4269 domain-containing protein [uncultured Pontibacter sp.]